MLDTMTKSELPRPEFTEAQAASGFNQFRVAEHGSINVTQTMRLILAPRKCQSVKKVLDGMVQKGLLVRHHSKTVERDSRAVYKLPETEKKNGTEGDTKRQ
jgi:hypothetical protein